MLGQTLRVAARVATGSTYAILGWQAARSPGPRVGMAASTLASIRKVAPLPVDDELVVRANGAVQTIAGTVLATGRWQGWAALVLAGSLVPTTVAGHAFWDLPDPGARAMQRVQFHKNVAMLGGLLFAAAGDTPQLPRIRRATIDENAEEIA